MSEFLSLSSCIAVVQIAMPYVTVDAAAGISHCHVRAELHFHIFCVTFILLRQITRWRSWLRHCATSWKFAGSISDGVIGFFH